jgi:cysteinyl-tRNA synthetase
MALRLYNSLTRRIEAFQPVDASRVTMYVCGPTVYHYVHIGNARPYVVFGLLARLLRKQFGHEHVVYARNITDVDDKINAAAAAAGAPISEITGRYAKAFHEDMAKLGADLPDIEPRATAHIGEIIAMCQALIAKGCAYVAEGHVLFDVAGFPEYGRLSGRSTDDMIAGARVEVAPYKNNPADFVLWKPSTPELPGWDSPWGRGRPGWHIECSAMAAAHLGDTIDIHAGGVDLVFPHHENEIAQSTCAHGGKTFARFWLHNGMLTFEGRKMSKSLGNVLQLHELLQRHPPEVLRLMLLKAHYRQPLDWSDDNLKQIRQMLDGWYGVLRDLEKVEILSKEEISAIALSEADLFQDYKSLLMLIEETLCDDLNTPKTLTVIARLADKARSARNNLVHQGDQHALETRIAKTVFIESAEWIGLLQQDPEAWFKWRPAGSLNITLEDASSQAAGTTLDERRVNELVKERDQARAARDFARADAIRDELATMGIAIEDGPQGTRWKVANP